MTLKCESCDDTQTVILPSNDGDLGSVDEYPCPCCVAWPDGFGGLSFLRRDNNERVVIMTPADRGQRSTYIPPPLLPNGMSKLILDSQLIRVTLDGLKRPPVTNKPAEEKTNG